MNPLIQLRKAIAGFLFALACFGFAPSTHALLPPPPPDGGYPGNNTAEGTNALFNLTTGADNTAVGLDALFSNTTGNNNTATGIGALGSNTIGSNFTAMASPNATAATARHRRLSAAKDTNSSRAPTISMLPLPATSVASRGCQA